jgi:hypothetical protein
MRAKPLPSYAFAIRVAVCIVFSGVLRAAAVSDGDTTNAVIDELGAPMGRGYNGATLIYYYARGIVEFQTGAVIRADLLTDAEARSRRERQISRRVAPRQTASGVIMRNDAPAAGGATGGGGERADLEARLKKVEARLAELNTGYAASRTHWKRRQIKRERATLAEEKETLETQLTAAE